MITRECEVFLRSKQYWIRKKKKRERNGMMDGTCIRGEKAINFSLLMYLWVLYSNERDG